MSAGLDRAREQLLAGGWERLHPYRKWQGAHWRLVSLVELGEVADPRTGDMLDHVLGWLDDPKRLNGRDVVAGRARRCASQEGNAVWAACALGEPAAVARLAECLVGWQWPDGGWNCDRRPEVTHASFHETVWPARGLAAYHEATGEPAALDGARHAVDFLLRHRLFRSERTGAVIDPAWLDIHWPPYWHYDVLQGLRAVAALGGLARPEAADGLAWLRERREAGRWTTSGRRWWSRPGSRRGPEVVDWTELSWEVVTRQAREVLASAGEDILEQPAYDHA